MDLSQINFLAVVVAAVVGFGVGAIWYSPVLFSNAWLKETGIKKDGDQQRSPALIFGLAFLATLVIAFNLAMFLGPQASLATGALYGFFAGFGWVAMSFAINDLFELRSFKLYAINAGYYTLIFTIMGAIIGAWH